MTEIGNVLSLFDGYSCGQIALEKAGVRYGEYFASEIKPHAIQTAQLHYPGTVQIGDVTKVKGSDLPSIDLFLGGSPCQDLSIANSERGGLKGKKSKLFFEYVRLLNEVKPRYFLLENVAMNTQDYNIISEMLGTFPVRIDSALVTAMYRDRYYWTNIGPEHRDLFGRRYSAVPQPADKKIKLQDMLDGGGVC